MDQQKILTKTYFYHPLLDYKNIFLSPPARLQKHISITPCSTKTYFYHQLLDKNIFLSPPTRQKHISITTYSTTFYHHLLDKNIFLSPPTRLLFTASATSPPVFRKTSYHPFYLCPEKLCFEINHTSRARFWVNATTTKLTKSGK